jgi:hypothetical protein
MQQLVWRLLPVTKSKMIQQWVTNGGNGWWLCQQPVVLCVHEAAVKSVEQGTGHVSRQPL